MRIKRLAQFALRFLMKPSPARPRASSESVAGSGTDADVPGRRPDAETSVTPSGAVNDTSTVWLISAFHVSPFRGRECHGAEDHVELEVRTQGRERNIQRKYAIIERLRKGEAVGLPMPLWTSRDAPDDAMVPALAVPVIFDDRLYRVAVYGAHQTGAALDRLEVDLLVKFAARAAIAYERLEMRRLRAQLGE